MKKGDLLEGIVTRGDYPGKGIVETQEGICVVKNVLPGQRVSLRVTKKRRGKAEGTLQEVLEKSPVERTAPCPHFGACGGCVYLNLPEKEAWRRTTGSKESSPVPKPLNTAIRWSLLLATPGRTAPLPSACTKGEAFMTLSR